MELTRENLENLLDLLVTANILGTRMEMATDIEARSFARTNLKMVRRREWNRILPSKHAIISKPKAIPRNARKLLHEWSLIYSESLVQTLLLLAGTTL
jgi:hypothetical protein